MIILDSNVWIAILDKRDSLHEKGLSVYANLSEEIGVPESVIIEVVTILYNKSGKERAELFVESIINNKDIRILFSSKESFIRNLLFFINNDYKKLSLIDQILVHLSKDYKVITFDKNLQKALEKK